MKIPRWLYLKIGLKRWILLAVLGILFLSIGVITTFGRGIEGYLETWSHFLIWDYFSPFMRKICGFFLMVFGVCFLSISFRQIVMIFVSLAYPGYMQTEIQVKNIYQQYYLKKGPRIVVVGGGTGLSVLLRGLKQYTSNITAIVSVADDGGSSGRLRGQLGILPPGDLRNCLIALADTEPSMEKLFNYRFTQGKELAGHSLGNLLIAAMADLTGSFDTAINEVGKVLAIRGKVIPTTCDHLVLGAELEDGTTIMGESLISQTQKRIKKVFLVPAACEPVSEAINAIREADAIILGPGSLYTSVIPNLLVPGIVEALEKAQGMKIYVCNVLTQAGETRNYTAGDHLEALYAHSVPGLVDCMIVNNTNVPVPYGEHYAVEGVKPVAIDRERITKMQVKLIQAPLLNNGSLFQKNNMLQRNNVLWHDSQKLASLILRLVLEEKAGDFSVRLFKQYFRAEKSRQKDFYEEG